MLMKWGMQLGIPHTFTANDIANAADLMDCAHNAEYTYMARETENIMDYSQLNATRTSETMGNRYALFYWQKKIWTYIDRLNNTLILSLKNLLTKRGWIITGI